MKVRIELYLRCSQHRVLTITLQSPYLVPSTGFEPANPFGSRSLSPLRHLLRHDGICLVPLTGFEPVRLSTREFETRTSTIFITGALFIFYFYFFLNGLLDLFIVGGGSVDSLGVVQEDYEILFVHLRPQDCYGFSKFGEGLR